MFILIAKSTVDSIYQLCAVTRCIRAGEEKGEGDGSNN